MPTKTEQIVQTLQGDAQEAAWRTAGTQLVKLTRDPLAGLLHRHLGPDDPALRAKLAGFLQTEVGTALLAGCLAAGLTAMPGTGGTQEKLARELRIQSMTGLGDALADVVAGPLRQVMAQYLQGVPATAPMPELSERSELPSDPTLDPEREESNVG